MSDILIDIVIMFDIRNRFADPFSARRQRKARNKRYKIRFRKGKKAATLVRLRITL